MRATLTSNKLQFEQVQETSYTTPNNPRLSIPINLHIVIPVHLDGPCVVSFSDLIIGIFYGLGKDHVIVCLPLRYPVVGIFDGGCQIFDDLALCDLSLVRELVPVPFLGCLAQRALGKAPVYLVVNFQRSHIVKNISHQHSEARNQRWLKARGARELGLEYTLPE